MEEKFVGLFYSNWGCINTVGYKKMCVTGRNKKSNSVLDCFCGEEQRASLQIRWERENGIRAKMQWIDIFCTKLFLHFKTEHSYSLVPFHTFIWPWIFYKVWGVSINRINAFSKRGLSSIWIVLFCMNSMSYSLIYWRHTL